MATTRKYEKLPIDFDIPEDLEQLINEYVDYLNNPTSILDDYYRTEIQLELNWCYRENKLTDEQIMLLREHYQYQGIKKEKH